MLRWYLIEGLEWFRRLISVQVRYMAIVWGNATDKFFDRVFLFSVHCVGPLVFDSFRSSFWVLEPWSLYWDLNFNPHFIGGLEQKFWACFFLAFVRLTLSFVIILKYVDPRISVYVIWCSSTAALNHICRPWLAFSPVIHICWKQENKQLNDKLMDAFCECSYISGYKNRFQNFIKYLREMGDEVMRGKLICISYCCNFISEFC